VNNLFSSDRLGQWLIQDKQLRLRQLVVVLVLLLSVILPLEAPKRLLPLVVVLPLATVVVFGFMRWPPLGLIATMVAGMVVPFYGPSGLNVTMMGIALLLGLWFVDMIARQREVKLIDSRTVRPLLALLVVTLLAFSVGQLPWFGDFQRAPLGAQLGGMSLFILSAGTFLLVANQVHDLRWLKWMTWVFLGVGGLFVVGRLVPALRPFIVQQLFQRGAFDSLFYTWLVSLAFSQAVFNRNLHWTWRLVLGGLVAATFLVTYGQASKWKSGWMPPLASVSVMIVLRSWRSGLLLAAVGAKPAWDLAASILATEQYSYSTRLDAWQIVFEIVKANPIFGLGPANYRWYTPLFRIRGYDVQFNSHNQYVDQIAQTGLLGLACLLWFFWEVGRLGWQLRQRVPPGFAQAYVYAALGGLCGTVVAGMLGDWVVPFFYNIGMQGFRTSILAWLFLGGLVAIEKMVKDETF
jgi:O-antigen ligase